MNLTIYSESDNYYESNVNKTALRTSDCVVRVLPLECALLHNKQHCYSSRSPDTFYLLKQIDTVLHTVRTLINAMRINLELSILKECWFGMIDVE